MIPFRTMLVAADLSESSRQAFRVACSLAREEKTRICVVHVVEPNYVTAEPVYSGQQTIEFSPIARELGCDLIVMGTHGRTGLGRLLMGSVAEKVLRGADCPVLTVRVPLVPSEPAALSS